MHPNLPLDQILIGDCRELSKTLPAESVNCVVTSPPYWGLRSYGTDPQIWSNGHELCVEHQWGEHQPFHKGQVPQTITRDSTVGKAGNVVTNTCSICGAWRGELGLEPTPELYVEHLVEIFRECKRVLRDDGTLWLNLGDSYNNAAWGNSKTDFQDPKREGVKDTYSGGIQGRNRAVKTDTLKPKDLVGIPWMVAFALRADGWYLRSDIIWSKLNPMPESVTDRPTKAHEYIFLLSKSQKYYYDADAVREPISEMTIERWNGNPKRKNPSRQGLNVASVQGESCFGVNPAGRNRRTVWTVSTKPFRGAHFATFPPKLIEPCILAGTSARGVCPKCGAPWERVTELGKVTSRGGSENGIRPTGNAVTDFKGGGMNCGTFEAHEHNTVGWRPTCACDAGEPVPAVVLDPFMGSGTTASVCISLKRHYIGFDLNPAYVEGLAQDRADNTPPPLFVW